VQGVAVRGIEYETNVLVRVIDGITREAYDLKELDGLVKIQFEINPTRYLSRQTFCQGLLS
jgi:hypothetical protein